MDTAMSSQMSQITSMLRFIQEELSPRAVVAGGSMVSLGLLNEPMAGGKDFDIFIEFPRESTVLISLLRELIPDLDKMYHIKDKTCNYTSANTHPDKLDIKSVVGFTPKWYDKDVPQGILPFDIIAWGLGHKDFTEDIMSGFDFNLCKVWYDGTSITQHQDLKDDIEVGKTMLRSASQPRIDKYTIIAKKLGLDVEVEKVAPMALRGSGVEAGGMTPTAVSINEAPISATAIGLWGDGDPLTPPRYYEERLLDYGTPPTRILQETENEIRENRRGWPPPIPTWVGLEPREDLGARIRRLDEGPRTISGHTNGWGPFST